MKKKVLLLVSILLLSTLILSAISAANQTNSSSSPTAAVTIDAKAKACLQSQLGNCSAKSLEEKIFGTLAGVTSCAAPLIAASENGNECWPAGACNINQTAQAVLALGKSSTSKAQNWLESKTIPAKGLEWYLQIETIEPSTCTISYSGESHTFQINEDKSLSRGAGSCLTLEQDYMLKVSNRNECFNVSFSISCDQSFLVTKMYKPLEEQTFYLSEKTNSGSPGATAIEKIDAACFSLTNTCNYKDSLWAALALDSVGKNISRFIPYLVVFAEQPENQKYLPSSFLYILTNSGEYRDKLLAQQKEVSGQYYWDVSGYRYYDSALALLAFPSETPEEESKVISWLTKVQGPEGCWNSKNIRDTAFILHSIFGAKYSSGGSGLPSCSSPNYCLTSAQCGGVQGAVVEGYSCSAGAVCCNKNLPTCSEVSGIFCKSNEFCKQGNGSVSVSDSSLGLCCVGGTCEKNSEGSGQDEETCIGTIGSCKDACEDGESKTYEGTCTYPQICCKEEEKSNNSAFIIILILLIALAVLGIVFKDKLKIILLKLKSNKMFKGKTKEPAQQVQRGFPGASRTPYSSVNSRIPSQGIPPQRIPPRASASLPPRNISMQRPTSPMNPSVRQQPPWPQMQRKIVKQKTPPEVEEILKKLKEIGENK